MIESYYTPEQREDIRKRGEQIGEEGLRRSQEDWAELIAEVRVAKDRGADPMSAEVLDLARRWMGLVRGFTGGDPGIEQSLGRLWKEQGDAIAAQHDPRYDPRGVMEYLGPAMAAVKGEAGAP